MHKDPDYGIQQQSIKINIWAKNKNKKQRKAPSLSACFQYFKSSGKSLL